MIPEAAVEAAAKAEYGNGDQYGTWETEPAEVREMYLNDARKILEAAAPHMLREAWDEGSVAGWVESGVPHSWGAENSLRNANPYRSAK